MAERFGIVKTKPEPYRALESLEISRELLKNAERYFEEGRYLDAYNEALGAIRMSTAALMFIDGRIAPTLESATEYVREFYPQLNAEEWRRLELNSPQNRGAFVRIMDALGVKKTDESAEAGNAVTLARYFVAYADKAVGGGFSE